MIRILVFVLALLGAPLPAAADQAAPRLDTLFKALKQAPSLADAIPVENTIWTIWLARSRLPLPCRFSRLSYAPRLESMKWLRRAYG